MKFRAKLTDVAFMKLFSNIISTLSKMSRTCVMRLTPVQMLLIIPNENIATSGSMACCILQVNHFFDYYKMVGVSDEENEIVLEFPPDLMAKSMITLKTVSSARFIKIRLTNRDFPCLTFELDLASGSHSRICTHEVPVNVVPRRQWSQYSEPTLPSYDISIEMPGLKLVKSILERMKSFNVKLDLLAKGDGTLVFKVENDTVDVATTFRGLRVERMSKDDSDDTFASAQVDIKSLILFLSSEQLNPRKIMCNILDETSAHMLLTTEDLVMHYFPTTLSTT